MEEVWRPCHVGRSEDSLDLRFWLDFDGFWEVLSIEALEALRLKDSEGKKEEGSREGWKFVFGLARKSLLVLSGNDRLLKTSPREERWKSVLRGRSWFRIWVCYCWVIESLRKSCQLMMKKKYKTSGSVSIEIRCSSRLHIERLLHSMPIFAQRWFYPVFTYIFLLLLLYLIIRNVSKVVVAKLQEKKRERDENNVGTPTIQWQRHKVNLRKVM